MSLRGVKKVTKHSRQSIESDVVQTGGNKLADGKRKQSNTRLESAFAFNKSQNKTKGKTEKQKIKERNKKTKTEKWFHCWAADYLGTL